MSAGRQKVAVVTGGGGGIGAAVAEQLGRDGWFVVTVDPLVTLDGSATMPEPQETTAGRITAAGGSARASSASVTDGDAVRDLFNELADERGLDAVVNVAGITRPTTFARGSEEDWLAVLSVHLGGYLNVLEAALPIMAEAGRGHIVGVTSGSGWRAADAGAYSCAKRAVASLTWQLGRCAPAGVTINAMSPIAETRMVTEALERARRAADAAGNTASTGGLSLGSLPAPEDLGPIGAYLAGDAFGWCNGRVLFVGGSEVAFIDEPRLLEVVRTVGATSLARVLEEVVPRALSPAEAVQGTTGGGNPRFGSIFEEPASGGVRAEGIRSCAVVSDRPELTSRLTAALKARSVACHAVELDAGFGGAAKQLEAITDANGPLDGLVVAPAGDTPSKSAGEEWQQVLASHRGIVERIHNDAGWARATADHAREKDRPLRLLTLTDGRTPGGRSRAQASAQLARSASGSTKGKVSAYAVSLEASGEQADTAAAELVAHLLAGADGGDLAGAELVVDSDWLGLRSHPRPIGSVVYGGPSVPGWLDRTLRDIVGERS
jgi:NAD(P)-dependent dehydrogenase (short-subunit alcohol dehydrogenase family)